MLFISAGFDAHREDDMGSLGLTEADYEWVTRHLLQIADQYCAGRIVSVLEGGYDLSALRERQVSAADFERFDLLLAMDEANLAELRRRCPPQYQDKVRLLMEFAPDSTETEVADPYFGGAQGFEQVG
ncbi:hypothetical protein C3E98_044580, partial [Pseudomonas sp. MWU13-2625]